MKEAADRFARIAPWVGLFALAAGLSLVDIQALDYWWHLRTGQLIAETGEVPRVDLYTYSATGARWIDIHWLHQLGLWGTYRVAGHSGVVLLQGAIVIGTLALLAPVGARRDRAGLSAVVLALATLLAAARFTPRPEVTSFVLLAAVVHLLDRFERRGDAWIYALIPVQLLWANVHGLFALGIALCAIQLASEGLRPLVGQTLRFPRLRRLGLVLGLTMVASCLNPNGIEGALYPLQQFDMLSRGESLGFFSEVIVELSPTLEASEPLGLSLFLGMVGLSLAALLLNLRNARLADLLTWIAFLYLALSAMRNVAIFALVAAPIAIRNANDWLDRRSISPAVWRWTGAVGSAALLVLAADAFGSGLHPRLGQWRTSGLDIAPDFHPRGAVDWIEANRPPGPIAHDMGLGGYLVWRLYPNYRVLIDGRLEVYGPETFERLWIRDMAGFTALDTEFHFGTVITRDPNRPKVVELLAGWVEAPEWRLTFVDDKSAVFVREPTEYPEIDLDAPDLFPPLDAARGPLDVHKLTGRVRFYSALGRDEQALAEWERGLEVFPDVVNADKTRRLLRRRIDQARGTRR